MCSKTIPKLNDLTYSNRKKLKNGIFIADVMILIKILSGLDRLENKKRFSSSYRI